MLDRRRIYFSGKSSYIITLPKKWVEENELKPGSEVVLSIGRNFITIYPRNPATEVKKVEIDAIGVSGESLLRRIISYYLSGANSMKIKIYDEKQRDAISRASEMLMGAEVVEDTGREVNLEIFLDNRLKPQEIIKRIGNTCTGMISDFCKALRKFDKYICNSIIFREKEVDRLYFLLLRQLKQANIHAEVAAELDVPLEIIQEYRTVVRALERISDHAENMALNLLELGKPAEFLCEFVEIDLEMLRTVMVAFLERELELAEVVLEEFDEIVGVERKFYSRVLSANVEEALNLKSIVDSLSRIARYSADIAEVVVNIVVHR